jgi:hypothetical protein
MTSISNYSAGRTRKAGHILSTARSLAGCGLLALTLSVHATDQVPIKAAFNTVHNDTFGFDPELGPIAFAVVEGEGNLSHFGRATCFSDDQIAELATGLVYAVYTYTAANGDSLIMWMVSSAEIDFVTLTATFSGEFVVIGGTGRFANATGSGITSGWAVFKDPFGLTTNHGPGYFEIDGHVSSSGSLK